MSWSYFPKDSSYYEESVELYNSKSMDFERSMDSTDSNEEFFYVEEIARAHSSGYEQFRRKYFKTFDAMLEYLKKHVPIVTVEEWSYSDSFFVDQNMKIEAPKPNDDFINILLNPKRLHDFMKSSGGKIYGPYSKFCCLTPFEIHIYSETFISN